MPYVRAHYRRPRASSGAGSQALGCLFVFGLISMALVAAGTYLVQVVQAGVAFTRSAAFPLGMIAIAFGVVAAVIEIVRWRRRRNLDAFLKAAADLASRPDPSDSEGRRVLTLGVAAGTMPARVASELEAHYRNAVAQVVADHRLSDRERSRLATLQTGFDLSPEVSTRARLEGYLQAYAAIVADGRLTEEEEQTLSALRRDLEIPETQVAAQLAVTTELARARAISTSELSPVDSPVRLRKGEVCYHTTPFTEKKLKIARTYVSDGVRYADKSLETVRSGSMYVTNERALLVANGTTTIKLEAIFDAAVDADNRLLVLTVDGRKTPYYFEVPAPFVTAAYVDRAAAAA